MISTRLEDIKVDFLSDIGTTRDRNEDFFIANSVDTGKADAYICALSDGMGGLKDGDMASKLACEIAIEHLQENLIDTPEHLVRSLHIKAISKAHAALQNLSIDKYGNDKKIGATLITLSILGSQVYAANIGDSSLFFLKPDSIRAAFNTDRVIGSSNILTQCVGASINIAPTAIRKSMSEFDSILICTDGLTDVVSQETILDVFNEHNFVTEQVLSHLVNLALSRGSQDNITVAIISERLRGKKYE